MKLWRQLQCTSQEIRARVVDTAKCMLMPVPHRRSTLLNEEHEVLGRRSAFAAVTTADGSFVARVLEGTSGAWAQKQYGCFETWTQAQSFAAMLNERHGIDSMEANHIIVSASLASTKSHRRS
jgi:hypothetical protein